MEKGKLYTIPVTKRIKQLFKRLSWRKGHIYEKFLQKYGNSLEEFMRVYRQIKEVPRGIIDKEMVITKSKQVTEAFMGYLAIKLIEAKGDIEKARKSVREDLSLD